MLQILEKITSGHGEEKDIEKLERLGRLVQSGSLCGLGKTASNPVLTSIRYFREEYEEHIHEKYCRAKVCTGLGFYRIEQEECILCGLCKQACAFDAVVETRRSFYIDQVYCTKCKACYQACLIGAVKIEKQKYGRLEEELSIPPVGIEIIERRCRMKLKDILESKPQQIVTVYENDSIADVIQTMSKRSISSVFILDEHHALVGIFTERDIVRCVTENISFENVTIGNVMRRDVITFDPYTEISAVISTALRKKIRHLPIVEGKKILGMVTFRDLISYLLPETNYVKTF
jgi:NADH-quinone oxidoreductase subunit F/NADP-reducing hydrogenase subunit HndC